MLEATLNVFEQPLWGQGKGREPVCTDWWV